MLRFRRMKSLQKFVALHASFRSHFNQERHLVGRQTCKIRRAAALAECHFVEERRAGQFHIGRCEIRLTGSIRRSPRDSISCLPGGQYVRVPSRALHQCVVTIS